MYRLRYPNRGRSWLGNLFLGGHRRALGRELSGAGFDEVLIYAGERPVIKRWLGDLFRGRVTEIPQSTPPESLTERYRGAAARLGCDMDRYDADPILEISAESRCPSDERGLIDRRYPPWGARPSAEKLIRRQR